MEEIVSQDCYGLADYVCSFLDDAGIAPRKAVVHTWVDGFLGDYGVAFDGFEELK